MRIEIWFTDKKLPVIHTDTKRTATDGTFFNVQLDDELVQYPVARIDRIVKEQSHRDELATFDTNRWQQRAAQDRIINPVNYPYPSFPTKKSI